MEVEFDVQFNDLTMLEANGRFDKVCEIMSSDIAKTGAEGKKKDWMIRSTVTIMSPFGYVGMICHFYNTGKVYIAEYYPSTRDLHNQDIRFLTYWANEYGWKTPEPLPSVVDACLPFWKKEWETYIVELPNSQNHTRPIVLAIKSRDGSSVYFRQTRFELDAKH